MRALALVLLACALSGACSSEEIVLARLPAKNDAGVSIDPRRCEDDQDCGATAFCARAACGDVAGTCAGRPSVCDEAPMPVCGCDGVTYWNDCLRRTAAVTSMFPGECPMDFARTCGGHGDHGRGPGPPSEHCPAGATCARLLPRLPEGEPFSCPPEVPGICWALPIDCP